jgi:sigma-54 specific flagellar transcriptional regulator A
MKQGFFELANFGTLFLDEIGEISLDLQAKLLKVIETGKFFRIGGTRELQSSIKLICATNRDLETMIANGQFREDLFMRISTLTIKMPALTERKEDIPTLIQSLLPKCCSDNKVFIDYSELPQDLLEYLTHEPISGNIRGLEQQLSRLLIFSPRDQAGKPILSQWEKVIRKPHAQRTLSKKQLTLKDLLSVPIDFVNSDFPGLKETLKAIEKRILIDASIKYKTNKEIASVLKVHESLTSEKLSQLRGLAKRARRGRPRKESYERP